MDKHWSRCFFFREQGRARLSRKKENRPNDWPLPIRRSIKGPDPACRIVGCDLPPRPRGT
ncbi:hypothetical protein BDQ94DRAFT_132895 [Aspergillus welwitschiae]|uniref:Uncharacterized protein n=1 Tax=Aspergillus welwitschiae TaxID=1341132 RepID=A0A3F3QKF0_9EURO|nr:hypothetical protein BDQ94DRAFT_132895 [Aspergillus welwitschiae]RDH39332.1 hypothetical protein BDQ94DRAFT_132895 [Aspergillus welwitschiae]